MLHAMEFLFRERFCTQFFSVWKRIFGSQRLDYGACAGKAATVASGLQNAQAELNPILQ